jgi:CHAT domain-containing protein
MIVPDGPLFEVPFPALRNPKTTRYVAEDYEVVNSLSIETGIIAVSKSQREFLGPDTRVLAVGNPSSDHLSDLPALPGAELELQRIAARYPRTTVLLREAATESAFLREAPLNNVLHVAAHSVANARKPYHSSLLLAPGDGRDGILFPHEIPPSHLDDVRLVILAGCKSGGRPNGLSRLAAGFLEAGARDVIVSLWNVEDKATAEFFGNFYEALSRGAEVPQAFRSAQNALIKSRGAANAGEWAAFAMLVGGA